MKLKYLSDVFKFLMCIKITWGSCEKYGCLGFKPTVIETIGAERDPELALSKCLL